MTTQISSSANGATTFSGTKTSADDSASQLTHDGSASSSDANGNTTQKSKGSGLQSVYYTFDHHNRLVGINNQREPKGPIVALEPLEEGSTAGLSSNSEYAANGITNWIDGWKRRGWTDATMLPVNSREPWERLDAAIHRHKVAFEWVNDYAGIAGNERTNLRPPDREPPRSSCRVTRELLSGF